MAKAPAVIPVDPFAALASASLNLPAAYQHLVAEDELGAGIEASFGIVGYKGKVWRIKFRGNEEIVTRPDDGTPAASLEVVIVKASPHKAKTYYAGTFVEGSVERPDCWSNNGQTPDPAVPTPVHPVCATCPMNVFGSKTSDNGSKAKACQDHKRVAVIPLNDMANEIGGGPMLLRIPPASLQAAAEYGGNLKRVNRPQFTVGTRITFDPEVAHPQFQFRPMRVLTEEEIAYVIELRDDPRVERILNEGNDFAAVAALASPVPDEFAALGDGADAAPAAPAKPAAPKAAGAATKAVQAAAAAKAAPVAPKPTAPVAAAPKPAAVAPKTAAPAATAPKAVTPPSNPAPAAKPTPAQIALADAKAKHAAALAAAELAAAEAEAAAAAEAEMPTIDGEVTGEEYVDPDTGEVTEAAPEEGAEEGGDALDAELEALLAGNA